MPLSSDSDSESESAPAGTSSTALPSLARQRQMAIEAQLQSATIAMHARTAIGLPTAASIYGQAGPRVQSGQWVAFSNTTGAAQHLPGPNGGGGIGLPNFVPLGHPSLEQLLEGEQTTTANVRERHASKDLSQALGLGGDGSGIDGGRIGLEGRPYVSNAERNRAESRTVSEATMMLASLARDAAAHGTPRTIEKHNTTLNQLRVFAAGGSGNSVVKGLTGSGGSGAAVSTSNMSVGSHMPRSMPTFEVDKFMRSNLRMVSAADRLTAAEVLRVEPYERDPHHIATLSKFLLSVPFFAALPPAPRDAVAAIATLRALRKDEVVYREGEESRAFFVVLSGSVGTRVRDFADSAGPGFVAATTGVNEIFGHETLAVASSSSCSSSDEGALLSRAQTKVALERGELLCVDARDYHAILRAALHKDAAAKMDFVSSLPLFERCSLRELHRVASAMTACSFPKNSLVLTQGHQSDKVFFIVSGEARVVSKIYSKVPVVERRAHSASVASSPTAVAGAARHGHGHSRRGTALTEAGAAEAAATNGVAAMASPTAAAAAAAAHASVRSPSSAATGRSNARTPSHASRSGAFNFNSGDSGGTWKGGGGGGAYKFDRARSFSAARHGSAHSTAVGATSRSVGASASAALFDGPLSPPRSLAPIVRTELQLVPQLLDLGRLGPLWWFGELGVLSGQPRSASVYAETHLELMCLSRDDFLSRVPSFCLEYLRDYTRSFYAPPQELRAQWRQQRRWEEFKGRMLHTSRRTLPVAEHANNYANTFKH